MRQEPGTSGQDTQPVCYRHPERETYIRCSRCERPVCPECMVPASVGFQCPECVREGSRSVRQPTTTFGGRVPSDAGRVSKALIGLTALVFLGQLALPASFTNTFQLVGGPALDPVLRDLVGVATGEWYRLLTAAFLHSDSFLLHIGFNMYALWLFGPPLEAVFGRARFLGLYVLCALAGSAASYAFSDPLVPSLGASGAIFGLFAAYLVVSRKLGRDTSALLVLLGINVVIGFAFTGIDWRAHAGGFLAGAAIALALVHAPRERRAVIHGAGYAAVALAVLGTVVVRTAALTGGL